MIARGCGDMEGSARSDNTGITTTFAPPARDPAARRSMLPRLIV
jgi:hypothetical protein